jgi:hypothetical protein
VQELLKEGWLKLPEDEKDVFREWTEWDKKRYTNNLAIFEGLKSDDLKNDFDSVVKTDDMKAVHVPKKRKQLSIGEHSADPKKRKP